MNPLQSRSSLRFDLRIRTSVVLRITIILQHPTSILVKAGIKNVLKNYECIKLLFKNMTFESRSFKKRVMT